MGIGPIWEINSLTLSSTLVLTQNEVYFFLTVTATPVVNA